MGSDPNSKNIDMNIFLKSWLKLLIRWGIGLIALLLLFFFVDVHELLKQLRNVHIGYFAIAMALSVFGMQIVRAVMIKKILKLYKVSTSLLLIYWTNLSSAIYGFVTPGELGAVVWRIALLGKSEKQYLEAGSALIVVRWLTLGSAILIGFIAALTDDMFTSKKFLLILILGLCVFISVSVIFLFFSQLFIKIFSGIKWIPHSIFIKLIKLAESTKNLRCIGVFAWLKLMVILFVFHVLGIWMYWILLLATDINIPIISLIWIRSVLVCLRILPISIGGLGVREISLAFLLAPFGVSKEAAIKYGLTSFAMQVVMALLATIIQLLPQPKLQKCI